MGKLRRETVERRLLDKRSIEGDCWIWTGTVNSRGYGECANPATPSGLNPRGRVHRVAAWLWLDFDLASQLHILHRCDHPLCFNPEHLFVGTASDNMRDMAAKGRHRGPRGETHHKAKLTADQVREVRRLRSEGLTYQRIGDAFGVTKQQVGNIVGGSQWKSVR
jgi:hypothetical protein